MAINRWYAIKVSSRTEPVVAHGIAALEYRAFLPMERYDVHHARAVTSNLRPLLPGYLFAEFEASYENCSRIAEIAGVITILGTRHAETYGPWHASPIKSGEIEHLMAVSEQASRAEEEKSVPALKRLPAGTRALIHSGVLANITGLVVHDDRGRVLLHLDKNFGGKAISVPREMVCAARA